MGSTDQHQSQSGAETAPFPCVFDRLLNCSRQKGAKPTMGMDGESYRAAVRRDLEWLLNARRQLNREEIANMILTEPNRKKLEDQSIVYDYKSTSESVLNYGMRDFGGVLIDPLNPAIRLAIIEEIEEAIRLYEPRIVQETLKIEAIEQGVPLGQLAFGIEGELWVLPHWEQLRIDVNLDTGSYAVKSGTNLG